MHTQKPFKARNVVYDEEGNIVILPFETAPVRQPEEPRAEAKGVTKDGRSLLRVTPLKSLNTLSRRLRGSIRLPKLPTLRKFTGKCSAHENPRVRVLWNTVSFGARFTAIFLLLFVSLNAASYWQVGRAWLLPGAGTEERRALQVMTDPLLSVPELPLAGKRNMGGIAASLDIAPPDDRLIIPKMGKNVPLISVSPAALKREDWKTFEKDIQDALLLGVVRYPGTAEPGEVGNVFLTGHSSNYPWILSSYNAVLARLPTLEVGDEYSLYYQGKLHRYRIAKKFEVSPKDVSVLEQPLNRRMSTLMTCTPIGTTLRRLILQADEVDPVTGEVMAIADSGGKLPSEDPQGEVGWGVELPI